MKYYTLKELVPDITGVDEDNYALWESAYQAVKRINKLSRSISSYSDTSGIPENKKDDIVNLYRGLYNDPKALEVLKKLSRKEHITDEESELLFDLYVNSMSIEEDREIYSKYRDEVKSKELKDRVDKIISLIVDTVQETGDFVYKIRLLLLDVLSIHIECAIENYKEELQALKEAVGNEVSISEEEARIDKLAEEDKIANNYPRIKNKKS